MKHDSLPNICHTLFIPATPSEDPCCERRLSPIKPGLVSAKRPSKLTPQKPLRRARPTPHPPMATMILPSPTAGDRASSMSPVDPILEGSSDVLSLDAPASRTHHRNDVLRLGHAATDSADSEEIAPSLDAIVSVLPHLHTSQPNMTPTVRLDLEGRTQQRVGRYAKEQRTRTARRR